MTVKTIPAIINKMSRQPQPHMRSAYPAIAENDTDRKFGSRQLQNRISVETASRA